MNGAGLVAGWLVANGVKNVFAVAGTFINPLWKEVHEAGIKLIETRSETAAAYMADGWARSTGELGVCMATCGTAHGYMVGGLTGAYHAHSPVLSMTGFAAPASQAGRGALQEIDQVGLARPVSKWAHLVATAEDLEYSLARAMREALSGRMGPVHLTIPLSIQEGGVADGALKRLIRGKERAAPAAPDKGAIASAVRLLNQAKRPLIVVGSGVRWAGACEQLQSFAERANLPVFSGINTLGCLPDGHPLCFDFTVPMNEVAGKALKSTDVMLVIGGKLDWELDPAFSSEARLISQEAKVVQIDILPEEIGHNRAADLGIVSDAKAALDSLLEEVTKYPKWEHSDWLKQLTKWRSEREQQFREVASNKMVPPHPAALWQRVADIVPEDSNVVVDGGGVSQWVRPALKYRRPGHGPWFWAGSVGGLGHGIPFALAAKLARPEEPSFVLSGDGAVGFFIMELDTAMRNNLPVVVIVANDYAWGSEMQQIELLYGSTIGCQLRPECRYDKIAQAMGAYGELVESLDEVGPAIKRAVESRLPALLNVPVARVLGGMAAVSVEVTKVIQAGR